MTPMFQRPLALGVDAVIHSCTKYINGHSDVIMGAVITNSKKLDEHLLFQQLGEAKLFKIMLLGILLAELSRKLFLIAHFMLSAVGAVPSPFDTYLVYRGIKTLHLRMRQHMENGLAVAKWLEADSRVEKVRAGKSISSFPQMLHHFLCFHRCFIRSLNRIRSMQCTRSKQPGCPAWCPSICAAD